MLPHEIESELFYLKNRVSDTIIEYITDEFWKYRLRITCVDNCDVYVYFDFEGPKNTKGELRIDRFQKTFEISARNDDVVVLPVSGDWSVVLKFLTMLVASRSSTD